MGGPLPTPPRLTHHYAAMQNPIPRILLTLSVIPAVGLVACIPRAVHGCEVLSSTPDANELNGF